MKPFLAGPPARPLSSDGTLLALRVAPPAGLGSPARRCCFSCPSPPRRQAVAQRADGLRRRRVFPLRWVRQMIDARPAFRPPLLPDGSDGLRLEVRKFLREQAFEPRCGSWLSGFDPGFSRRLAARGWVGMTWPARYGGGERTALDRHVVAEELLAAGAPVAAHWISDRQIG